MWSRTGAAPGRRNRSRVAEPYTDRHGGGDGAPANPDANVSGGRPHRRSAARVAGASIHAGSSREPLTWTPTLCNRQKVGRPSRWEARPPSAAAEERHKPAPRAARSPTGTGGSVCTSRAGRRRGDPGGGRPAPPMGPSLSVARAVRRTSSTSTPPSSGTTSKGSSVDTSPGICGGGRGAGVESAPPPALPSAGRCSARTACNHSSTDDSSGRGGHSRMPADTTVNTIASRSTCLVTTPGAFAGRRRQAIAEKLGCARRKKSPNGWPVGEAGDWGVPQPSHRLDEEHLPPYP
ncbi:hypothetical protein BU14_0153s0007 [Porphyra umbilicalis]|uniref:Uncharacterized protein n=1 Tax=Porphyra umbilicalis TaxID=2786 RepID=A0A1X6P8S7_PORUM|nr:hypothetical protein BU14_0153s0007 [Porphyra umbilicalis]|eukprot:OSX77264.1 hypothetical protein BU14_0153s0007 [Porphyra umbilicalis]